jgi:ubiquinone/menaquinone biosynthesis C-methylase UbiE
MSALPVAEVPSLQSLADAVSTAHVVEAAAELGLIDHLSTGPRDASELAHACATDLAMTALLLDTLAALGVVRRDTSSRYELTVDGLPLVTGAARGWSRLVDVVRSGEPLAKADTAEGASALYPDVVPLLSAMFTPAARRAAQLLAGSGVDVLDVGAGAAPWSTALATYSPGVRVTALDLPAVVASTRRAVDAADLGDRFEYLAGDAFTCRLHPAAYDLVLLGNICHLFDEAHNRAVLQRLRPAVRPGGLLAIIDVLAPPAPGVQRSISLYALGLRLRTSRGTVHPLAGYEAWTSDAGFGPVQVEPLSATPPLSLLACRKL